MQITSAFDKCGLFAANSAAALLFGIFARWYVPDPVRKWLSHSDAVIAVSNACTDLIKKDAPPERLHVIHNGLIWMSFQLIAHRLDNV